MNYLLIFLLFSLFDLGYPYLDNDVFSLSHYFSNHTQPTKHKNKRKKNLRQRNNNYLKLNTTNVITLKGVIDGKSVNRFLYDFNLVDDKDNLYVFIDSVGGSVEDGYKVITEFQKYNVSCIVEKAYSMAFAILQICNKRLLLPHGKIMQHQISLGVMNELGKIESYLHFISQIEKKLLEIQSKKIGISSEELKNKTLNEWWLFGENAIKENCVDKIVNVECSHHLTRKTYVISDGMYDYTYSRCPLIPNYLDKVQNNKNNKDFIYFI